jgi:hypothetical protein
VEHLIYLEKMSRKARSNFDRAYLAKGTYSDIED